MKLIGFLMTIPFIWLVTLFFWAEIYLGSNLSIDAAIGPAVISASFTTMFIYGMLLIFLGKELK
jgi:hypothetical protein